MFSADVLSACVYMLAEFLKHEKLSESQTLIFHLYWVYYKKWKTEMILEKSHKQCLDQIFFV